ncbi:hypothetical protein J7J00_00130 [Bacillus sp. ISL-4]|nr:hypothetical protein [Bacillus sp. ISL-4]MBT2663921.1 hypothetical protein [Bacillus sp. ISL-4]
MNRIDISLIVVIYFTPQKKHLTIFRLNARSKAFGTPTFSAVLKEETQPQVQIAFGLSMVKPPPIIDCLRMLIYQGL